jgi:hypothetical protein
MGGKARIGGFGLAAAAALMAVGGCTNLEKKYDLPPPDRAAAYPHLLPRAPTPPQPVLSAGEQKATQADLENAGKRLESIPPAHLQGR